MTIAEGLLEVPRKLYDYRCGAGIGALHIDDLDALARALTPNDAVRLVPGGVLVSSPLGTFLAAAAQGCERGLTAVRDAFGREVGRVVFSSFTEEDPASYRQRTAIPEAKP